MERTVYDGFGFQIESRLKYGDIIIASLTDVVDINKAEVKKTDDGVLRLKLPDSVFYGSYSITVREIDSKAFINFKFKEMKERYKADRIEIELPEGLHKIGPCAFYGCEDIDSFVFHDSVEEIGAWAFSHGGLSEIRIPDSVEKLSAHIFNNCRNLKSVKLPDNLEVLPAGIFLNCTGLQSVNLSNCSKMSEIDSSAFSGCKTLEKFELPDNIEKIGFAAFSECSSLYHFAFPRNLTSIGPCAFQFSGLESAVLPERVNSIGHHSFYGCDNLEGVYLPDEVKNIPDGAFANCANLKSISLPSGLLTMCENALSGSQNLNRVIVPEGISRFNAEPFRNKKIKFEMCSDVFVCYYKYHAKTSAENTEWSFINTGGTTLFEPCCSNGKSCGIFFDFDGAPKKLKSYVSVAETELSFYWDKKYIKTVDDAISEAGCKSDSAKTEKDFKDVARETDMAI